MLFSNLNTSCKFQKTCKRLLLVSLMVFVWMQSVAVYHDALHGNTVGNEAGQHASFALSGDSNSFFEHEANDAGCQAFTAAFAGLVLSISLGLLMIARLVLRAQPDLIHRLSVLESHRRPLATGPPLIA
jgi:hypothetical protein